MFGQRVLGHALARAFNQPQLLPQLRSGLKKVQKSTGNVRHDSHHCDKKHESDYINANCGLCKHLRGIKWAIMLTLYAWHFTRLFFHGWKPIQNKFHPPIIFCVKKMIRCFSSLNQKMTLWQPHLEPLDFQTIWEDFAGTPDLWQGRLIRGRHYLF